MFDYDFLALSTNDFGERYLQRHGALKSLAKALQILTNPCVGDSHSQHSSFTSIL
jgi:hypothetical protein